MTNEEFQKDPRIHIYGNKKEIAEAEGWIDSILPLPGTPKRNSYSEEPKCRLILQKLIDEHKIKASILFEGNSVWSYDRLVRDFKRFIADPRDKDAFMPVGDILRLPVSSGNCPLTDYLYSFFSLECGTIAHYDKHGWHATYPDVPALRELFKKNEFGDNVVDRLCRDRFADSCRIVKEMQRLLDEADPEKFVQQVQAVIGS